MRICFILEGSYPYMKGGVSNWVHEFILENPQDEFVLWMINDVESRKGNYAYTLPKNVVKIQEVYLETALKTRVNKRANPKFNPKEKEALRELIHCGKPDWNTILDMFHKKRKHPVELLMSEDFLNLLKDFASSEFPYTGFTDLFWTLRSMFLPLLYLLGTKFPEADLYHSVSTGYAGVIGAMASKKYNKPMVLTEHGIYTREREEEILRSDWAPPQFKRLWINMFQMYSIFAYETAVKVTSLFSRAKDIQIEIGCKPEKTQVIGNGVSYASFAKVPEKKPNGFIDIGCITRVAPIKDVKTLIYTFAELKQERPNTRLFILGHIDDEEYYQECVDLIEFLGVQDIRFEGVVNIIDYMAKLDFTTLTSISEGQPFAVLESMAARRPVIATNVGCCKELIEGDNGDEFGVAGICVPPMNQKNLYSAFIELCDHPEKLPGMGHAGSERVKKYYDHATMVASYQDLYKEVTTAWQA